MQTLQHIFIDHSILFEISLQDAFFGFLGMDGAVFCIWKPLSVLQKACIKVVACVVYIYQFFSFKCKIKSCGGYCFPY